MADDTSKPKRKRRRWLIAGVLLFVAATVWWYWPRGDARFIGKWALVITSEFDLPVTYVFGRRHVETQHPIDGPLQGLRTVNRWSSHGETLQFEDGVPLPFDAIIWPILEGISPRLSRFFNHMIASYTFRFSDDGNSVTLLTDGGPEERLLKRVAE